LGLLVWGVGGVGVRPPPPPPTPNPPTPNPPIPKNMFLPKNFIY